MTSNRKLKTTFRCGIFATMTLLLAGCLEAGEDYTEKNYETGTQPSSESISVEWINEKIGTTIETLGEETIKPALNSTDEIVDNVSTYLEEQEPSRIQEKVGGFFSSLFAKSVPPESVQQLLENEQQMLYEMTYLRNADGDTATFELRNAYQLVDGQITPVQFNGDTTFLLSPQQAITVRFLLVDSTEISKKQPFSIEAKQRTNELLVNAESIYAIFDEGDKFDHYDRALMYVFADDTLVQETLVREGLAKIAYVNEPNTRYLEHLRAAEALAKKDKIGVWSNQ